MRLLLCLLVLWLSLTLVVMAAPEEAKKAKGEETSTAKKSKGMISRIAKSMVQKVKNAMKKKPFPTSGCVEHSQYLRVCNTETRVTYTIGDSSKGKVMDDDLEELSTNYAVYHIGRVKGVSDIQYNDERETSKGKRHKYCQAPSGSRVHQVRATFSTKKKHRRFKELEFIWREPDGDLFECGVTIKKTGRKIPEFLWKKILGGKPPKRPRPVVFGQDGLTFLGFRVLKADKYIRLMDFEFGKSVPGMEAKCSTGKMVAVIDEVLTDVVKTESVEQYEGTNKIETTIKSMEHQAGLEVKAKAGFLGNGGEVTASYSFTHSSSHEKSTEQATSQAKTKEISVDLTDKFQISYYLMVPCEVPDSVTTDSGSKIFLAPFDHRLRRLVLPIESCISETETITGKAGKGAELDAGTGEIKGGNVDLTIDGGVDLSAGSCVLPQKFIWFDEQNLVNDINHLVDRKGSNILNKRDDIPVENPEAADTVMLHN